VFYPPGLSQSHWFNHFASEFNTVEINNTFYRLPTEQACDHWREQAPHGFTYAVKASRFITHVRRLKDCAEPLETFLSRVRRLGDHLGPILYQLPPRWSPDPQRLAEFAALLPGDLSHVFEFRDPRWFNEPVQQVLSTHHLAFCIFDMPGVSCPHWVSGPLVYLRFHGSQALYAGRYTHEGLTRWTSVIRQFLNTGHDVYAYFNNDISGNAIFNARELSALLGKDKAH
jgi:uncharacterized protein YecE (DUF72 family)